MTSLFREFDCKPIPKEPQEIEVLEEIADSLSGESGRKLPPKFRYYHILRDILGVKHMGSLYNPRLECIWSLHNGVFTRE